MKFLFIITFLCLFNVVFAQKGIFIEPTGGLFMPFSQNQKNTQFLKKRTYTSFNLGISLRYQTNDKWHFLLGYYFGLGTSTNFSFKDKAETLNQEYSYLESVAMNQIRVLANRKLIENIHVLRLNKLKDYYLLVFDVGFTAGVGYNYLFGSESYNNTYQALNFDKMASQTTKINDNNLMLYVGTYFQFKQWDGNALCLSLLYGKGLSKLQETTINYQLGQENYQHIISSNGDIFIGQISIPIRLSKRKESISNGE